MGETAIKCSSCEVRLQGHANEKKRIQQLFIHFIGDKHVMRLRVAVKGEEIGANVVEEVVEETSLEEKPEEQEEEELVKLPDPLIFSQHHWLTEYEGEVLLAAMAVPAIDEEDETYEEKQAKILLKDVSSPAPKLHQCSTCATGLMTAKFMLRHFDSNSHKNREEAPSWRKEIDMSCVYEHGPSLFFCLVSNSGYFDPDQLAIHQSTKAYKKLKEERCADEQAKEALFSKNIPCGAPRCDNCNRFFVSEAEMSRHMLTKMHSIRTDQLHSFDIGTFTDNDDLETRLAALPGSKMDRSSSLPSKLESQRGRIAMVFESSAFVLVHFKLDDVDTFALFDRSRVVEKGRDVRPVVGYPVMFHACKIDPPVAGISRFIHYWATQVVLGDHVRSLVLGMTQTYAQLKREVGGAVEAGLEDCKAEIKADMEFGEKGVVVGQWKEVLRSIAASVIRADPSCLIVKMENGEVGLQILEEETMMTKEPRDWATIDSSITIGDKVMVHAMLMDPQKKAPYLCTAVWRSGHTQPQVHREKVLQAAIDMYHTLALALPDQLEKKEDEEEEPMDTADDDDLAADDDLMADDDLADDDDLAADQDDGGAMQVPKIKFGAGLKIAGFAK